MKRVAIIGHTGRGGYGHYLEMAMMAHASHKVGTRVSLPLPSTNNPFDDWI